MYTRIFKTIKMKINHNIYVMVMAKREELHSKVIPKPEFDRIVKEAYDNFKKVKHEVWQRIMKDVNSDVKETHRTMLKAYLTFATVEQANNDEVRFLDKINAILAEGSKRIAEFEKGCFYEGIEIDPLDQL